MAKLYGALGVRSLRSSALQQLGATLLRQSARYETALAALCKTGIRTAEKRLAVQVERLSFHITLLGGDVLGRFTSRWTLKPCMMALSMGMYGGQLLTTTHPHAPCRAGSLKQSDACCCALQRCAGCSGDARASDVDIFRHRSGPEGAGHRLQPSCASHLCLVPDPPAAHPWLCQCLMACCKREGAMHGSCWERK